MLRSFVGSDADRLKDCEQYRDMPISELKKLIDDWNKKRYADGYFEMFAVIENDVIVGQASLYGRSEHIVSCGLEVYAAHRRKGYGARAYGELLSLAQQKGYTIAVAQVRADNSAGIALHEKTGFEAEDYTYVNKKGEPVYCFIRRL